MLCCLPPATIGSALGSSKWVRLLENLSYNRFVDEIVIDANLVLQCPHGMSLDPRVDDDDLDSLGGIMYMPSV